MVFSNDVWGSFYLLGVVSKKNPVPAQPYYKILPSCPASASLFFPAFSFFSRMCSCSCKWVRGYGCVWSTCPCEHQLFWETCACYCRQDLANTWLMIYGNPRTTLTQADLLTNFWVRAVTPWRQSQGADYKAGDLPLKPRGEQVRGRQSVSQAKGPQGPHFPEVSRKPRTTGC